MCAGIVDYADIVSPLSFFTLTPGKLFTFKKYKKYDKSNKILNVILFENCESALSLNMLTTTRTPCRHNCCIWVLVSVSTPNNNFEHLKIREVT